MPDFIIIDRVSIGFWIIVGDPNSYDSLSEALLAADKLKARQGGIIANISGKKRES